MVASLIRCIVVEIPLDCDPIEHRLRRPARELLPWADPYIAQLIRNLQDEVREERAAQRRLALDNTSPSAGLRGEAPPRPLSDPIEFEVPADDDWPLLRDVE